MPSPRDQQTPSNRQRRRKEPSPGSWPWMIALAAFVFLIMATFYNNKEPGPIDYSKFEELARDKKFSKVVIRGDKIIGDFAPGVVDKLEDTDPLRKAHLQ